MSTNKRDTSIDIAKALGILLMILGHISGIPFYLRNSIFSFHMPLFFIFSGYFFKEQPIRDIIRSGNRHLIKPYVITSVVCILLCITAGKYGAALDRLIGAAMANGGVKTEMFGGSIPFISPIWFLLALYWCKIFYAWLKSIHDTR